MSPTSSDALRQSFLEHFAAHGHTVVPSSSLVPERDPSLLFVNAGMVQFKDVFLGRETRPYTRATTAQRCLRAGGKHNDLDNVGYTARHHTFFEMLGNFSFGDYFKREAIRLAWDYLVRTLELPRERLWVTVHADDGESARLWREEIGVPAERLVAIAGDDNFWAMGETGPCGPSTEIFYDHGPDVSGGPPGSGIEGDRYVEIWNVVFMQFDRDAKGALTPLPRPCVDTGMGLERISAVMQGVVSNYDIDLFRRLRSAVAETVGVRDEGQASLRVIADHVRAAAFLATDGVTPGNEGRGYVLRRILRRAVRHGVRLGADAPFLDALVPVVVELMGSAYPALVAAEPTARALLRAEEERFRLTLREGLTLLETELARTTGRVLPGAVAFRLSDTYGFPLDLTQDVLRERGWTVDVAGFEKALEEQRTRARRASSFRSERVERDGRQTLFTGYETLVDEATVLALEGGAGTVVALEEGAEGRLVLDRTPFYPEGGGQLGDRGVIRAPAGIFHVHDTQRQGASIVHLGRVEGTVRCGERVVAEVEGERRRALVRHHSATHLVHAALRRVLGEQVQQRGSLVAPERLRFDFTIARPPTPAELVRVEEEVTRAIVADLPASVAVVPLAEARAAGALAFFGEKYGERVRTVGFGDVSLELCGGTHVARTGEIGGFKIVAEGPLAAGVRRLEAVAGLAALRWAEEVDTLFHDAARRLGVPGAEVAQRIEKLLTELRGQERRIAELERRLVEGGRSADLLDRRIQVGNVYVLAASLDGVAPSALREAADRLRARLGSPSVVLLASVVEGRLRLLAAVTPKAPQGISARALLSAVAPLAGARGGGRDDFAEAGGGDPEARERVLSAVPRWVEERLRGVA
jgi:alanyl-tRNA synthetase